MAPDDSHRVSLLPNHYPKDKTAAANSNTNRHAGDLGGAPSPTGATKRRSTFSMPLEQGQIPCAHAFT